MIRKFRVASIGLFLVLSGLGIAENLIWDPSVSSDVKGYRVVWGPVGGIQNTNGVGTNLVVWTNPVTGLKLTKPGLSNITLLAATRYQFVVYSTNATVVSSASQILFYTPLDGPANGTILGE